MGAVKEPQALNVLEAAGFDLGASGVLLDSLYDAVIATDMNFVVLGWNPAAAGLYGWTEDEARGKTVDDLVRGDWSEDRRQAAAEAFVRDGVWQGEVIQHHRDGTPIHVQSTVSLLRDARGEPVGAVAVNRDVTESRHLGDSLQRREQELDALNALLLAACDVSRGGVRANQVDDLVRHVCESLSAHTDLRTLLYCTAGTEPALHAAGSRRPLTTDTGPMGSGVCEAIRAGGARHGAGERRADCAGCPARADARPANCLALVHEDTHHGVLVTLGSSQAPATQEHRVLTGIAEEVGLALHLREQQRVQAELERDRERVLRMSQDLICIAQVSGRFEYVNPAWERALGHSQQELPGMSFHKLIFRDDLPSTQAAFASLSSGQGTVEFENRCLTNNGELRTISWTATSLPEEQLLFCIGRDVTDRRRMEQKLLQSGRLEAVGQLAAGIAHEINTPLQYIGDNARFLGETFERLQGVLGAYENAVGRLGQPDASEAAAAANDLARQSRLHALLRRTARAVQSSIEGVEQVSRIVRSLKEFAHPGEEGGGIHPEDLNAAITSTLAVARNEYKHTADVVTVLGELSRVPCDLSSIKQVLLNLVVNAAHAIREKAGRDSIRGSITIRSWCSEEDAFVQVEDDGTGIREDIQARIFEPFFTTKPVGSGTGQGLAIAHSIVEQRHGGSLTVRSTPGQGASFRVRLPLKHD